MIAEIISIGNELLGGETVNTNASFIAQKLSEVGVEVRWITTIGDDENEIFQSLEQAEKRADVIISTGGLGPTHDDITKNVFVRYFDAKLVFNAEILNKLRERFRQRNLPMSRCNEQQAYVPDKAKIVENEIGTAPGLLFEKGKKLFFVLPGVPVEMEQIVTDSIVPMLKEKQTTVILKRVIHTIGIPESTLFARLGDVEELEKTCKIAFLPQMGRVDIRLTATGADISQCEKKIIAVERVIEEKAGQFIWGYDDETLEKIVVDKLQQKNLRLAVVESGTEGIIISDLLKNSIADQNNIQGFVFSDLLQARDFFGMQFSRDEKKILNDATDVKQFSAKIAQNTGADLTLFVNFSRNENREAHIFLFDGKKLVKKKELYPIEVSVALQRLVTSVIGVLYQYLNK
ncbi:hypothetical protein B6D60_07905 [candidate division KSB1 bacterium 4484_87]|nr:MAG: hypothetical protein B6D60_07905 [candidate division KSB1 bacterium 4484_87]